MAENFYWENPACECTYCRSIRFHRQQERLREAAESQAWRQKRIEAFVKRQALEAPAAWEIE